MVGKMKVNDEFGGNLFERLDEKRKVFRKELEKERGNEVGMSVRMKREDRILVYSKEDINRV